jgi:hypothetical protein
MTLLAGPGQPQEAEAKSGYLLSQLWLVLQKGMVAKPFENQVDLGGWIEAVVGVVLLMFLPGFIKSLSKAVGVIEHPVGVQWMLTHGAAILSRF